MYRIFAMLLLAFMLLGGGEVVVYESSRDTSDWVYEPNRQVQYAVAVSPEEWNRQLSQLEPPLRRSFEIDWETEFPILVYLGEHRTGGYVVNIDKIVLSDKTLTVQVSRRSPGPGEMVTMAFTYPTDLVTLPREYLDKVEIVRFVNSDDELFGQVNLLP